MIALQFRLGCGSLLGDYAGGVFQTVSASTAEPVAAQGLLLALSQRLNVEWRVNAGYGRDNPLDSDIGSGERALNEAWFANVFRDWSKIIGFAIEGSRWRTEFKERGSTAVWRSELTSAIRF